MKILIVLTLLASSASFAEHKKAEDIPECSAIAKSCTDAKFKAGDHKNNGRGLWLDCIGAIAHGKTVAGVTGASPDDAKKCMAAMKTSKITEK